MPAAIDSYDVPRLERIRTRWGDSGTAAARRPYPPKVRNLPLIAAGAVALATLTVVGASAPAAHAAPGDFAYALSGTSLLRFDLADPAAATSTALAPVSNDETLVGIDVRPQNGELYALGVNATANTATLYLVHPQSGALAVVGASGGVSFTFDGTTPVDLPDPSVVGYGFDVNPSADRIRVVAGSLNFRVNPNTGAGIDGDNTGLSSGSVTGTNSDGPVGGLTSTVHGVAYTNNVPNNGSVTTLYSLDASSDSLYIQNPANVGTQTQAHTVTVGGSPSTSQRATGSTSRRVSTRRPATRP